MSLMPRNLVALCAGLLSLTALSPARAAQIPAPSVWELVEVSPVSGMDSNPRGMSNHREYYTADGRLCLLEPAETFPETQHCAKVITDGSFRILTVPNGEQYRGTILELSETTLTIENPDQSIFSFRRLEDASFGDEIRPESLHILKVSEGPQLKASDVHYLNPDSLPRPRSLVGAWETIAVRDVPRVDVPPFGFPNEKWVFTETEIAKVLPAATELAGAQRTPYAFKNMALWIEGSREPILIAFDRWGDLVLSTGYGKVTLRQISLDPRRIPAIPTKVALLVVEGE